ncbi:MAG: FlgD immunoglobulin-like domain containing protein [Candidatus Krumholzibacteriia bacterium]
MTHRPSWCLILCAFFIGSMCPPSHAADPRGGPLSFLDGFALVVLETSDVRSMHVAREVIHQHGGHIAIMSPPSIMMGWIPADAGREIAGQAGIRDIYSDAVTPAEVGVPGDASRRMVHFFNQAVRGELQAEYERFDGASGAGTAGRPTDAFVQPPIDEGDYLRNLESAGLDVGELEDRGLLLGPSTGALGNSDFMTGTVAVTLFFVESDGSGGDPDLYTWTPQDMQSYLNGAAAGLAWWSSQALSSFDCSVSFLINYYSGADPRCQQWAEPILHGGSFESTWVTNLMTNFGYTSGSRFTRVNAFNTWQRSYYQTDRSFSSFIAYNPFPAAATFPDGMTAFAYLGGPYSVLLSRVQGWPTANVFAHESGHIFWACDEYSGGCTSCTSTCGNGVANGNCEACNPGSRDCMMKFNDFTLCTFTRGQVGWGANTPCAPPPPPPLPAPAAAASYPASGLQGIDLTVTVGGANFFPGATVDFGPSIFVHTTNLVGAESLVVDVTVLNDSPLGPVDIVVRNRDGQSTTLSAAFEVMPTLRHYYKPGGGNVFPYITPSTAASSLTEAIASAFDGDTLFLATTTLNNISIAIDRGVLLHGAWNNDFTQRDLQSGKTVLNLNGNVLVFPGTQGGGLDGFVLQNGTGTPATVPFPADFGGAVKILGSSATVANCEMRFNAATTGSNYGVGGAIFARDCAVDLRDNFIHQNTATRGGGIYLYNCTGTVTGNTIADNTVSTASSSAEGGGMVLAACPDVTLDGNAITGNTGAKFGGGIRIEASTAAISGGAISGNQAMVVSGTGGGVDIDASAVSLSGVTISGNSASLVGGGVATTAASDLTVIECSVSSNTAILGGGIYAVDGTADVRHNLIVANQGTTSGGGMFLGILSGGAVIGNTLDQNGSAGVGGMFLPDVPMEAFNNIVANSVGVGIECGGTISLARSYNLVWNNSGGDYNGCGAGSGSIAADPRFADAAGGDYHLALHSPAIDAGNPDVTFQDPDGSRGDMGWYGSHALVMEQPSRPVNLTSLANGGTTTLAWSPNPEADVVSYAVYCDSVSGFVPSIATFVVLAAGTDSTATVPSTGDSAYYRISAVDTAGYAGGYSGEAVAVVATAIGPLAGHRFKLHQNVPNPFNPVTRIFYELQSRVPVTLRIYDVDGRLVRRLAHTEQGPGVFTLEWDGTNNGGSRVASGIYFYRLAAGGFVQTKKMVLLK